MYSLIWNVNTTLIMEFNMAIHVNNEGEGYFHGDSVKTTGKKDDSTYDITLHEFVFTEGRNEGEKFWQSAV